MCAAEAGDIGNGVWQGEFFLTSKDVPLSSLLQDSWTGIVLGNSESQKHTNLHDTTVVVIQEQKHEQQRGNGQGHVYCERVGLLHLVMERPSGSSEAGSAMPAQPVALPAIAYNGNFSKGFVAVYAPGLGPIPFTLASESFPSSHCEAIYGAFHARGTLGVSSVLNVIAFILVLFLIEETSSRSLGYLEKVYERPKIQLMMWVWYEQLPYLKQKWILWIRDVEEPVPYGSYGEERGDGGSETEMESLGEAR
ncbi:hypothetical protein F25303_10226 [Fusarium sp. NRRL 25303]|nr:hypothetical protein F25303_10226 [Fusarium sp. NRRL 25303]